MAKEANNEKLDEIAEDIEASGKSKSKKTKSTSQKTGQTPLLLMIGGALGGVVMIILSVIIGTVVANKLFPPVAPAPAPPEEESSQVANNEAKADIKKQLESVPVENIAEESILLADSDWLTFNAGAFASNVKGSTKFYGVIEFVATYKPYRVELLSEKGFLKAAEGEATEGKPVAPEADTASALYAKFKQLVTSKMSVFIASRTAEELLGLHSTGVLQDTLKQYLDKPFNETGLVIGKIDVLKCMVQ